MPHVVVKLWPGRSRDQKQELADRIARDVIEVLGSRDESVSVSFEEVEPADWMEKVYRPDIQERPDALFKAPGYNPFK